MNTLFNKAKIRLSQTQLVGIVPQRPNFVTGGDHFALVYEHPFGEAPAQGVAIIVCDKPGGAPPA